MTEQLCGNAEIPEAGTFSVAYRDFLVVHRLMTCNNIRFAIFPPTDAFIARYPCPNKLTVLAGTADLAKNRPPTDACCLCEKPT